MTLAISDFVNESPPSSSIGPMGSFLKEEDLDSPIDVYIKQSRNLLDYGTPARLAENHHLGGLLLLGVVSSAEGYFRSILSHSLEMCPVCRETSSEKQINLGGVLWHGKSEFRRSAFEHMSFSSKEELKNASSNYLKFTLEDRKFKVPLDEYDIACQLRHGLVHNGGILPGRNAVKIGIKSYKKPVRIAVEYPLLQNTVAAVDTLVLTFNREIFAKMCERWAVQWRRRDDWDASTQETAFRKIWKLYLCKELHSSRLGKTNITMKNCLEAVRSEYNL